MWNTPTSHHLNFVFFFFFCKTWNIWSTRKPTHAFTFWEKSKGAFMKNAYLKHNIRIYVWQGLNSSISLCHTNLDRKRKFESQVIQIKAEIQASALYQCKNCSCGEKYSDTSITLFTLKKYLTYCLTKTCHFPASSQHEII